MKRGTLFRRKSDGALCEVIRLAYGIVHYHEVTVETVDGEPQLRRHQGSSRMKSREFNSLTVTVARPPEEP